MDIKNISTRDLVEELKTREGGADVGSRALCVIFCRRHRPGDCACGGRLGCEVVEFVEVMRQLGRICASNFGECDICDLRPFCPSKTFLDKYAKSGRAERLEEMVMAWAAEHRESVYPTWYEYLFNVTRGRE